MAAARELQFNIRSRFARERTAELARQTGMTATEVVEEALRAYRPEPSIIPPGMVRRGKLLVKRATGRTITLEETNAAIEAVREERG